jgi:hypothetical protein
MVVAIIGSREFNDYNLMCKTLNPVKDKITLIVSGGAYGADKLGERFAEDNNIPTKIFIPDWDRLGKRAGFVRNKDIVNAADVIIAFWDGKSPGTASALDYAESVEKPFKVIRF